MNSHRYDVFGLCVCLPHKHPRLRLAEPHRTVDVDVRYGSAPENLQQTIAQLDDQEMQARVVVGSRGDVLWIGSFARFYVTSGSEIVIELSQKDIKPGRVLRFVVSYCLPAVLAQRGHLALHANAIATPAGAVVIAGVSGAGKSTLSAALMTRGYQMLSDDVVAISIGSDQCASAAAGFPVYRLCTDTMQRLPIVAESTRALGGVRAKFAVTAPEEAFHAKSLPMKAVYILEQYAKPAVEVIALHSLEKLSALRDVCYPPVNIADSQVFLTGLANVARHVPVYRIKRPQGVWTVEQLIDIVTEGAIDNVNAASA